MNSVNNQVAVVPQSINPNPMLGVYKTMFGNEGINTTKLARGWSPQKTPIVQFVQRQPIMQRSQIMKKVGQAMRWYKPGVSNLRLY